jgi:hypothetical protein
MNPRARDQLGDFKDLGANFGCNRYSRNLVHCARRAVKSNPDSTFDLGYIDLEQKTLQPLDNRSDRGCYLCLRYEPSPMCPVRTTSLLAERVGFEPTVR